MTDVQIIEAPGAQLALSGELQSLAREYVAARQKSGDALLEMARCVAAARDKAAHGEWRLWLDGTGTSDDAAKRLLDIHRMAEENDNFRSAVAKNWLSATAAGLLSAPSTPNEVRAEVLAPLAAAPAETPPPPAPSKREIEQKIAAAKPAPARPAPANSAPVRNPEPPPPAARAEPEIIAEVPVDAPPPPAPTPTPAPAPAPTAPIGLLVPMADLSALKAAEALVALLEQALNVAEIERDRVRRGLDNPPRFTLPDDVVEQAGRLFVQAPATRGAASFLAMSVREVEV